MDTRPVKEAGLRKQSSIQIDACMKIKRQRKPRQLWTGLDVMITFLVSGLWHGADWTFVIWGLMHGLYQTAELMTQKQRGKLAARMKINREGWILQVWQTLFTFILVCLAWVFFKAESLRQALGILRRLFALAGMSGTSAWSFMDGSLGLDALDMGMMTGMLAIYMVYEFLRGKHDLPTLFKRQPTWLRWIGYYALLTVIIVFGFYGETTVIDFVYFQF